MEEKAFQQIVTRLHRDLVQMLEAGGKAACDHLTVRTPYLPCPHPNCYSLPPSGPSLRVVRTNTDGKFYSFQDPDAQLDVKIEEEVWERSQFVLPNGVVLWAWRPAKELHKRRSI